LIQHHEVFWKSRPLKLEEQFIDFLGNALRKLGLVTLGDVNPKLVSRSGLTELSREFEVIVIDVSLLMGLKLIGSDETRLEARKYFAPQSIDDLHLILEAEGLSAVLDLASLGRLANKITFKCRSLGVLTARLKDGALPNANVLIRFWMRVMDSRLKLQKDAVPKIQGANKPTQAKKILRVGADFFLSGFWEIIGLSFARPEICFFSGTKSLDLPSRFAGLLVPISSVDLDNLPESPVIEKGSFLVFVDEAFSDAGDWLRMNVEPPVEPEVYYPWLRSALSSIEQQFGLPVVILPHPQEGFQRIDSMKNWLSGFEFWHGPSVSALPQAIGIVFHSSALSLVAHEVGSVPIALKISAPNMYLKNSKVKSFAKALGSRPFEEGRWPAKNNALLKYKADPKTRDRMRKLYLGPPCVPRESLIAAVLIERLNRKIAKD